MRNQIHVQRCFCRRFTAAVIAPTVVLFAVQFSPVAHAQITAQTLVGKALSDDSANQEVNGAINRFRDRDIDGCRAILERVKSNNPKVPPPGVMMSMLWLGVNQLGQARAELEDSVVKFPKDPEPYLMMGDLAFQDRRITDADELFAKATQLTAGFTENGMRRRDFSIRCHAGTAAVAEARKQWGEAEKHLHAWLSLDPRNDSAHLRMGIVLFRLNKPTEALEQFREAKKLNEKVVQPELFMARLYDEVKDSENSKKMYAAAGVAAPLGVTTEASDVSKAAVPDTAEAQAIAKVLLDAGQAWDKASRRAKEHLVLVPPTVWNECIGDLMKIRTASCPTDFREAWEVYLLASKDLCDLAARNGDPVALIAATVKGAILGAAGPAGVLAGGGEIVGEMDQASAITKKFSDAALNMLVVAKRYGVE
jgi:tetratricopeptide (TPR) repeat protein